FMGTVFWFESGKPKARRDKKQAVARLNEAINEVQRKPVKRVIWESISRNEDLFPGEAIRTAPNAEAKILFVKTGVTIQLDPDSLVVLEENDKGLSLDFLQGNLFVQSTGSQGAGGAPGGLTVKTGSGEINLKSADLSLSKDQSGKVNLEVYQ